MMAQLLDPGRQVQSMMNLEDPTTYTIFIPSNNYSIHDDYQNDGDHAAGPYSLGWNRLPRDTSLADN